MALLLSHGVFLLLLFNLSNYEKYIWYLLLSVCYNRIFRLPQRKAMMLCLTDFLYF
ncbi:hypothetical protein BDF20DRAFT_866675 [Mycotypha africana]|uniref:uncharacterized protein n=1 Tax=Mycotypha africana TaxID=64632 RepID=UPI0023014041|nr:uncharacterized protein BDF20DRAFT_866675 [Mycotypha africana]KAI8982394.1 hypothetical protein BDF20DRAFT_866675 [Mycotypha africana]